MEVRLSVRLQHRLCPRNHGQIMAICIAYGRTAYHIGVINAGYTSTDPSHSGMNVSNIGFASRQITLGVTQRVTQRLLTIPIREFQLHVD